MSSDERWQRALGEAPTRSDHPMGIFADYEGCESQSRVRGDEVDRLKALVDQLADASHALAMMGLQSDRYTSDPDYRDAVDNALAAVKNSGWKP